MQTLETRLTCYPFRTTLNNNAKAFHNGLFNPNGTHISENVNAYYLYGVGYSTLKTLESVEILNFMTNSYDNTLVRNTTTSDGDSMVPKWSAALSGIPNNNRIFRCSDANNGHTSIVKYNDYVGRLLKKISMVHMYTIQSIKILHEI